MLGDPNDVLYDLDRNLMQYAPGRINDFSLKSGLGGIVYYLSSRLLNSKNQVAPFDDLYLNELQEVINVNRHIWIKQENQFVFFDFLKILSRKEKNISFSNRLPTFLYENDLVIEEPFSKNRLGLHNGIAGYGLKLLQV